MYNSGVLYAGLDIADLSMAAHDAHEAYLSGDVDDDEDEPLNLVEDDAQVGGKSMQIALNILQKHSEIPGAGKSC